MPDVVTVEVRWRDSGAATGVRTLRGELRAVGVDAASAGATGSAGLGRIESASVRLRNAMSDLNGVAASASAWLGAKLFAATKLGALGIAGLVAGIGVFGIKAAAQIQTAQIAFGALLGSVDAGKALFKQLQDINLKTPFQLTELLPAAQLLLRYGVTANQLKPVLSTLVDAAALTSEPAQNLQTLALATGQVVATGHLQGQDARQLTQAGIPAYKLFASVLGVTTAQALKLGAAGKLSSDTFIKALEDYAGPLANVQGGAEKLSKTLTGELSNVKDALRVGAANAAQPLTDQLTKQVPQIQQLVTTALNTLGPPAFKLIGSIITLLLSALPVVAPLLATVVDGIGQLVEAAAPGLAKLTPVLGQTGVAWKELIAALVKAMPDMIKLLVALVQLLPSVIKILSDLVPLAVPIADLAASLLSFGPVREIVAGLLVVLLGYRALAGVIGTLKAFAVALGLVADGNAAVAATTVGAGAAGAGAATAAATAAGAGAGAGATAAAAGGGLGLGSILGLGALLLGDANAVGNIAHGVKKQGVNLTNPFAKHPGDKSNLELIGSIFGDTKANLGKSSRVHIAASGMTSGRTRVTSSLRNYGVSGAGSGHLNGTAWDTVADRPHEYAGAVRAMGGYATVHDDGSGRHVHSQIGDSSFIPQSPRSAGDDGMAVHVAVHVENAWGNVDVEKAVSDGVVDGVAKAKRNRIERGHVDETRIP